MSNVVLQSAFFAFEQLLKYAPDLVATFQAAVSRQEVSVEEIRARRHALVEQTFESLVPNSQLPPETEEKPAEPPAPTPAPENPEPVPDVPNAPV